MALTKEKKKEIAERLKETVTNSQSVAFVHFSGLDVEAANKMRSTLRDAGVNYFVAKKTLIKRTLDEAGIEGDRPDLEGEIALAYGDDLIAPAREIYQFQKEKDSAVSIVGGIFDGRYMTREEMTDVAAIPPREILYGQFANLVNSPLQGLVISLDQIAQKKEQTA